MGKDRSWMYGNIESSEFVNGVLEFCDVAVEHQVRTGATKFYCPCVKCGNVSMVDSVLLLREHILRHGFRPQYHIWLWHGEEGVYEEKSGASNMHMHEGAVPCGEVSQMDYECDNSGDEDVDGVYRVDEMLEGVEDELGNNSHVFESITNASQ